MKQWSDDKINKLLTLRKDHNLTWEQLSEHFPGMTPNALRKAFYRYDGMESNPDLLLAKTTSEKRAKLEKAKVLKENNHLLKYLDKREDLLAEFKDMIQLVKFEKAKVTAPRVDKKKRNMTMEIMLTDLHYGKKSKSFNLEVAGKRMRKMGEVVLSEHERYSNLYNVEHLITFLGGDIIENSDFHGIESRRASECGNSEQVVAAIQSIYNDYIVPIVSTGKKCTFVCVRGNHDRTGEHSTYQDPGKEDLTWIIYNMLKDLCKLAKYPNVTFIIPAGVYHVMDIYGSPVLYEHGDFMKGGMSRKTCDSHMSKRSKQIGKLIRFYRLGHFHESTMFGRGKVIVNASLAGQDGYSEINGYDSEASQTINYYIESKNRPDSFYHTFAVCLE